MSFKSFNEPLPEDYFAGGNRVFTRSKGSPELRRDSLADLLNDLRANSDFEGYQVDPNDEDRFSSIAEAFAVADINEPDGRGIKIIMADGTYADDVDFGTDHPIILESINYLGAIITGDLTFGNSAAKLQRSIRQCELSNNTIYVKDGCDLYLDRCRADTTAFNLDPSAGAVGYDVVFEGGSADNITVIETASSAGNRFFKFYNTIISGLSSGSGTPISMYDTDLTFSKTNVSAFVQTNPLIDFNGDDSQLYLLGATFSIYVMSSDIFANGASVTVYEENSKFIEYDMGGALSFGTIAAPSYGVFSMVGPDEPTGMPVGSIWHDKSLGDVLAWDGTYWGNGSIFRKNLLVDVDTAAVSHTSGWTVPTGAGVINVSANALKALTAGGGATLYGISEGSDGDKYAESSALIKNSKASAKQASINVGSGDTIYVHSMTSTGTEGGTLAGSNDEDVRVVVYFTMPKTLPSV